MRDEMKFLALFLLIPLLEVVVFVQVGGKIGAFWTLALTVGSAVLGAFLVRVQGLRTFHAAKAQLAQGETPAMAVIEGIMLLLAGVMLMIPGFLTDVLGAVILVPIFRQSLASSILEKVFIARAQSAAFNQKHSSDNQTIEGTFRRED